MKVLLINGSPKAERCTFTALSEVAKTLEAEGIETEIVHIGNQAIRGCIDCRACKKNGKCVFNDIVNEVAPKFAECDGLVVGMPVASSQYWNSVHGFTPEDVRKDEEGLQTMRTLGKNMTFLIKSIALGKEKYGLPEREPQILTNFID